MNSNYLYLMHESFPLLHLDFSPSFLHSKKPKVQPFILWENILRGCLASKKKKIEERKGKQRELYFTKCKKIQYVSRLLRDDFHPSYSLYKSKACDWLITRIRKEFTSKKYKRKDLMWSRHNRGDFAPKTHELVQNSHMLGLLCEIRTCMVGCAKFALSLMQLSSEGHIFLISAPNHTRFEALDS